MKTRYNFLRYAFSIKYFAVAVLLCILCTFITGLCKLSGLGFLAKPVWITYAIFCLAVFFGKLLSYIKYKNFKH